MENKTKKWSFGDILLFVAPFLYMIAVVIYDVTYYGVDPNYTILDIVYYLFYFVVLLIIAISYKKHEKNVMKFAVGGLIVSLVNSTVCIASDYALYPNDLVLFIIFGVVAASLLVMFFNHIVFALSHNPRKGFMIVSHICASLAIVGFLAGRFVSCYMYEWPIFAEVLAGIMDIVLIFMVIYPEYKVNYFKKLRQEKEEAAK